MIIAWYHLINHPVIRRENMKKLFIAIIASCICTASTPIIATQPFMPPAKLQDIPIVDTQRYRASDLPWYEKYVSFGEQSLFVPGELLVNFHSTFEIKTYSMSQGCVTTGFPSIDALNKKFQVESIEKMTDSDIFPSLANCYLFRMNDKTDILSAAAQYKKNPQIAYAEPNYVYYHCMIPNDPLFEQQWALHNTGQTGGTPDADLDMPEAWDIETGNPEIIIAVIDTGVDYTNPDSGNYTVGVTEEPFIFETSHPLNASLYKEGFNFIDCDAVSLHIQRFEVDKFPGLLLSNPLRNKLLPKTLFTSMFYNGTGTNLWTKYSEYGSKNNINILVSGEDQWGVAIDKVKKLIWRPLSEISPLFVDGYDFYFHDPDPMDDQGHGTHCIGIIAAETNNGHGIAGVAHNCTIMPIKVGGPSAIGVVSLFAVARGILYATFHGAHIISMSLGGPKSTTLSLALDFASNRGVIIVASAGNANMNDKTQSYPAGHPSVISVAATDHNDQKANFSNFGSWVDVAAPGVNIVSLRAHATDMYLFDTSYPPGSHFVPAYYPNATAYLASGTSMACPHAAGVAGLILSRNMNLTAAEVKTILRSSADPVDSLLPVGTGRINANTALLKTSPVVAELDFILDDQIVKGDVEIRGIARGADFSDFSIAYGFGIYPSDNQWIPLVQSTTPSEGTLAVLNTQNLGEGLHTIRLLVNANGFTYMDVAVIVVDNQQNTFYVDDDNSDGPWFGTTEDPFCSIQVAIESCGPLDKIFVASGIYKEKISIGKDKSIQLHGENKADTIIDGGGIGMSGAQFVTLEGFTLTNCSIALAMIKCYANKIYNNRFLNNSLAGIGIMYSKRNIFYNNDFINNNNHTFNLPYSVNFWYHPLKLRGNYWDDYTDRYPDAHPRLICSWSWNFPYKIQFYGKSAIPNELENLFRFTRNNDRFPLVNPS